MRLQEADSRGLAVTLLKSVIKEAPNSSPWCVGPAWLASLLLPYGAPKGSCPDVRLAPAAKSSRLGQSVLFAFLAP